MLDFLLQRDDLREVEFFPACRWCARLFYAHYNFVRDPGEVTHSQIHSYCEWQDRLVSDFKPSVLVTTQLPPSHPWEMFIQVLLKPTRQSVPLFAGSDLEKHFPYCLIIFCYLTTTPEFSDLKQQLCSQTLGFCASEILGTLVQLILLFNAALTEVMW